MVDFRIACQTITWGAGQREVFPKVFEQVAAAGYAGVEIGFRHIREAPASEIACLLRADGLSLVATHLGGNLFDAQQASEERGILGEVMDYMDATGTKLIMYSGLRCQSDDQLAHDIDSLNRGAGLCAVRGMRLLYHNHAFEFADGGRVIKALLERGSKDLGFCPDIGWVHKGGADVIEFLEKVRSRLGAIHFKDFATMENKTDTVVLGKGVVPLAAAASWLKANMQGLWVIAEQDSADIPPADAAAANAAYLKTLFFD